MQAGLAVVGLRWPALMLPVGGFDSRGMLKTTSNRDFVSDFLPCPRLANPKPIPPFDFAMGLRDWFRRFVSKVKEVFGVYDKYRDFEAVAYFPDGSEAIYTGKPWGYEFELFKALVEDEAFAVRLNMQGSFWTL
jgi:hypothetical protein